MILERSFAGVDDYDAEEHIVCRTVLSSDRQGIMQATIDEELHRSAQQKAIPLLDTFRGVDGRRMLIALWPK